MKIRSAVELLHADRRMDRHTGNLTGTFLQLYVANAPDVSTDHSLTPKIIWFVLLCGLAMSFLQHIFRYILKRTRKQQTKMKYREQHTFQAFSEASDEAVFWVVPPCSLVEVYQRFRGPCCLHHQGDDGGYNPEDSHLRTHRRENLKSYCL
jgi:hypothetical protein